MRTEPEQALLVILKKIGIEVPEEHEEELIQALHDLTMESIELRPDIVAAALLIDNEYQ